MQQHQCHQHHRRHGVALHSRQPGMPFQAFDAFLSRPKKKEVKRPTTCRCLVGVATDCCVFFFAILRCWYTTCSVCSAFGLVSYWIFDEKPFEQIVPPPA